MTAPMLMTDCPTPETIAAFVDDTLDDVTRRKTMEHIVNCGECRELVNLAVDFQATNNVRRFPVGWTTVPALAAAAVLAIFVLRPDFVFGPDIEDVIEAYPSLDFRPSIGRLTGDVPYLEPPRINRGSADDETKLGHARLLQIAAEAKDPHARGVAMFLIAAEREEYKEAIANLEKALSEASPEDKDTVAMDLAGALLSNFTDEKDHQRALRLSEDVLRRKKSLDAAWNRAAALESLRQYPEAVKAWDEYRDLDPGSSWAAEAKRRMDDLQIFLDDAKDRPDSRLNADP